MQKEQQAEKPKFDKNKKYMIVRHGRMNDIGLFEHSETQIPRLAAPVVIKTEKGLEIGEIVGKYTPYKGGHFKYTPQQISQYYKDSDIDLELLPAGRFARYATAEDLSEDRHLRLMAAEEIECCRRFVDELGLKMKIIDVEHIFGGERIIFYFMADSRVDFRELVKKIAHEYQTRIEMRQIGPRDEAKLLADYETCGQQCCCQRFLKMLKPVNMRMAKMQKATLDPSKISGYCGRLKCCLRYEDCTYNELRKNLPKKNTRVETQYGMGKVIDSQILTQLLVVQFQDRKKIAIPLEEVKILDSQSQSAKNTMESQPQNGADRNRKKVGNGRDVRNKTEADDPNGKNGRREKQSQTLSQNKSQIPKQGVSENVGADENDIDQSGSDIEKLNSVDVDTNSKEQNLGDNNTPAEDAGLSNRIGVQDDSQKKDGQSDKDNGSEDNRRDKKAGQENRNSSDNQRKGKTRNGNSRRKNKFKRRKPNQNKSAK